jgi:DNA-binding transcriptional MerR regulator
MYTIKEAATRSGVGIPLLRAWERRYGVVTPARSAGGYRLYDADAIARLQAMKRLIDTGWSAQQAADHVRSLGSGQLADIAADAQPTRANPGSPVVEDATASSIVARLVGAAYELDAVGFEAGLDEAYAATRFEVATDRVVMPAMREIGTGWERGEVSIAGEHAASHAVMRRMAMAFEAAGEPAAGRPILVGLGPGSYHELGALAFAVAGRRAGLPILYLGPNLPVASWVSAVEQRSASAAVVGAPTLSDAKRARRVIDGLRGARPDLLLAVGGDGAAKATRGTPAIALPGDSIAGALSAFETARAGS